MEIHPAGKHKGRFGFILMVLAVAGLMFSHSPGVVLSGDVCAGLVSGITMSIGTS